ncbi:MAG: flagellar motor switch protein FliN [Gammaproteobacteria bacterium]|nr:flagellar motor switch protein FliN [Gammaproteobacteria bacterium]
MSEDNKGADEALADEWAAALEEQTPGDDAAAAAAQAAQFEELQAEIGAAGAGDVKIDAILDVPITIAMEIGRSRINIRNLLQLNQGSVVELDRLAGEPMDVLVNGTLIAQGEVVVVNEKFGIRLTDIVSPADRVKKLGG